MYEAIIFKLYILYFVDICKTETVLIVFVISHFVKNILVIINWYRTCDNKLITTQNVLYTQCLL